MSKKHREFLDRAAAVRDNPEFIIDRDNETVWKIRYRVPAGEPSTRSLYERRSSVRIRPDCTK